MTPVTLTIGVDIGGTKVAGGVVDAGGRILEQHRVTTPARDAEATTDAIVRVIEELRSRHDDIEAVGLGIAGFVEAARSVVYFAPNLLGWRDGPLREAVEKRVNLPVVVENDANAAAWGEARFGAGREEACIVCVTLGTGVGGGIIVDRHLFRGGFGVARRDRAHPDGRGRPAVRLRAAGLLGAVRERRRPRPRGPRAGRGGPARCRAAARAR